MALHYDPKDLTDALELDYFRRPRPLARWLRRATWGALAASLLGVGWALWPAHRAAFQAGPVSAAHRFINHDCARCHDQPFRTAARLVAGDAGVHSVSDQACAQCHAGPDHNPHAPAAGCAGCHQEHHGRAQLAHVPDGACTACHGPGFTERFGAESPFRPVPSFAAHPEFALLDPAKKPIDPGTVKFNHVQHLALTEDQLHQAGAERGTDLRPHYRRLKEQQCAACHQADAAGRYIQPVNYDVHCAACHPLAVKVKGEWQDDALRAAAARFAQQPTPHPRKGQGPDAVRATLRERFLAFARQHPAVLKGVPDDEPERPLPTSLFRGRPASEKELGWVNTQLQEAERVLFDVSGGCAACHTEKSAREKRVDGLPDYGVPAIPERWYKHSVFRHDAHRMLDCAACHAGALTSTSARDVLMPGVADCKSCHSSAGGARTDCVECHQYHHRAPQQSWRGTLTIEALRPQGSNR